MSDDPKSLPVTWGGQAQGLAPSKSQVITPTRKDLVKYGEAFNACGDCRHFDSGPVAQGKIHGERFYERLVREEGWKVEHLCSAPEDLGLCGASNGETMTGKLHKGCDQFRPRNGLVRISPKATR